MENKFNQLFQFTSGMSGFLDKFLFQLVRLHQMWIEVLSHGAFFCECDCDLQNVLCGCVQDFIWCDCDIAVIE